MQIGILREPTENEKQDFIPVITKNSEADLRCLIGQKFIKRNRSILFKSKDAEDFQKNIKNLSCLGCFESESIKSLASDDFEECFSKYKNRLKFKEMSKTYNRNGLTFERGLNIWFQKCSFCGKNNCVSITSDEIQEELFKSLNLFASKSDGEV